MLLKFNENGPNCVYSCCFTKDITDEDASKIISEFKKMGDEKDDVRGVDVLNKMRGRKSGDMAQTKRALCYIGSYCFSVAIYPEQRLVEYACRKKARPRFEKLLAELGLVIEENCKNT